MISPLVFSKYSPLAFRALAYCLIPQCEMLGGGLLSAYGITKWREKFWRKRRHCFKKGNVATGTVIPRWYNTFKIRFGWKGVPFSGLVYAFHLQRWFGHAVILVQLFRCVTGFAGILGWRFSITYGIPFLGCDLRDWVLDAVLTGYLLAASIRSSTLFPPKVPVVKARFSHPLRKKQKQ